MTVTSRSQTRFGKPRRADARRSLGRAFVHRKNRFLAGKRSRHNTRAGGVSPPWGLLTRMQQASAHPPSAVRRTGALVSALNVFPTHHGGLTLAALCVRQSPISGLIFTAQGRLHTPRRADARRSLRSPVADRGLIFAARGRLHTPRRADARRSLRSPVGDRGLIFTARGRLRTPRRADARRSWSRVRLCMANCAFRSERTSCTRSG
jgi:hypothetical protein